MSVITVKCPICGKETQANDEKAFAFCTECGNRFELKTNTQNFSSNTPEKNNDIEKSLKEVAFYYNLSKEKDELHYTDKRPEYYEKAQEELLLLSKEFPSDYRVWWELCKPLDYEDPTHTNDINGEYGIVDKFFNKALDLAELDTKRKLIEAKDHYSESKKQRILNRKTEIEAENTARRDKEKAEQIEKQKKEAAEEQVRQEEIAKEEAKKKAEQEEQLKRENEEKQRRDEVAKKKAQDAAEKRPGIIALVLAILAWVSFVTFILPYVFGVISIIFTKKAKKANLTDQKGMLKGIFISDIAVMVLITVIEIVAIILYA